MNALTPLTISDIAIRQDEKGRYCLNDLHKAAGEEQKHRPKYWLENKQVIDLIDYLKSEESIGGIPPILPKQGLGTFAVKELVYAYAMWISAKFHIAVIRAYDALVTGQLLSNPEQLPEPKTKKALPGCLTLEMQDTIKALVKSRAEELPKEKQAGAIIKQWSAIKKKFGCSYKEVSPENFVNILSLLSRLPIEGELLESPSSSSNILTVDLNTPEGLKRIMFQFRSEGYSNGRWTITLTDGMFMIKVMEQGEFITTSEALISKVGDSMGGAVSRAHLPSIIMAAAKRLGA